MTPTALYVETSSFCRGRCRGCYVPARDRRARLRLDDAALADVIATARRLRPDWVCLVGGEPLDDAIRDVNLGLVRGAPDLRFLICTGAHGRGDAAAMRELAALTNLSVMFSVDGLAATHDRIRGAGSHARTFAAMRAYAGARGVICGASVTMRPDTWHEVTSPTFAAALVDSGCNLVAYDPCYADDAARALGAAALADAIARLRTAADPRVVVFVNPFGRLRRDGFEPRSAMAAVAIDYRGNVYASRRGAPLGNLATARLGDILAGEAFQRGCRPLGRGGVADDDPRAPVLAATLARLAARPEAGA